MRAPANAGLTLVALLIAACAGRSAPVVVPGQAVPRTPDVVFVPTPHRVVDQMLEVARVSRADLLYDLGSGDGRIVIEAARRFGARGVGIDIDPKLVAASRFNADTARVSHLVEFREADLFTTDLRKATVVTLYLLSDLNVRLRPKLFNELKPGSRVVSHSFGMGDWKADSTLMMDARIIYYWVMPANVRGEWDVTASTSDGDRSYRIRIEQQYQQITRADVLSETGIQVQDTVVRGDSVSFVLRDTSQTSVARRFTGRADGDSMRGNVSDAGGRNHAWRAGRTSR